MTQQEKKWNLSELGIHSEYQDSLLNYAQKLTDEYYSTKDLPNPNWHQGEYIRKLLLEITAETPNELLIDTLTNYLVSNSDYGHPSNISRLVWGWCKNNFSLSTKELIRLSAKINGLNTPRKMHWIHERKKQEQLLKESDKPTEE